MCEAGVLVSELLAEATVAAEIQHVCEARESGPRTGAWVGSCQRHCWSARVRQGALRVSKCPKMCTILNKDKGYFFYLLVKCDHCITFAERTMQ